MRRRRNIAPPIPRPFNTFKHFEYVEYLNSTWWDYVRRRKLRSQNWKCERCGAVAVQVHHKHYNTLSNERDSDLEALCKACHEEVHFPVTRPNMARKKKAELERLPASPFCYLTPKLAIALGSLVVHCEEALSPDGHFVDKVAIQAILDDPAVKAWMEGIPKVLLPLKRRS